MYAGFNILNSAMVTEHRLWTFLQRANSELERVFFELLCSL